MANKISYTLLNNSRFYILLSSILLSFFVIAVARLTIPSDQLFVIRVQQIFGLLCLVYWYMALIISPISRIVGKQRMEHVAFARRAIGVSAFYFALLHGAIAFWGQLGGFGQLQYLPELFQWALLAGVISLMVLGVMAATSFDKAVKVMTYPRWKMLHRLVYIAFILVIYHVWAIGTHLAYGGVQLAAFGALVVLFGLELYGVARAINTKYLHLKKPESLMFFLALWGCAVILVFMLPAVVQNYHSRHTSHTHTMQNEVQR